VTTLEWGMRKWAEWKPVASTPGDIYLRSRGISLMSADCLRFHPGVRHASTKQDLPALLALVTDPTGAPLAVQCTYLARDGKGKAKVERKDQRRTFGSPKGGAVRLAGTADGMPLLLGQGAETTLTAIEATGYPGWATIGTSGFVNIELPDTVQEIILLAENDESGANQKALDKVSPGLIERGIRVRLARPPEGVNDFNDLVKPEGNVGPHAGLVTAKMTIDAAHEWEPQRGRPPKPKAPKQVRWLPSSSILSSPAASFSAIDTESPTPAFRTARRRRTSRNPQAPVRGIQPLVAARLLRGKKWRAQFGVHVDGDQDAHGQSPL
jgi:hypothetical protein